jgi:hypothetical protein
VIILPLSWNGAVFAHGAWPRISLKLASSRLQRPRDAVELFVDRCDLAPQRLNLSAAPQCVVLLEVNSLTRCRLMACIMPMRAKLIGPPFSAASITHAVATAILLKEIPEL